MSCGCASPFGIFTGQTAEQLNALEAGAIARMNGGERTSLSGGQKSGSKAYQMSPQQVLIEVKYARRKLGLIPARVGKVYSDYVNPPCPPTVVQEQV